MAKLETIVIEKEGWEFLTNYSRTSRGFAPLAQAQLDRVWSRDNFKNGAGKKYPIADNEIRIDPDTFAIKWEKVKTLLAENGYKQRQDGYMVDTISLHL